MKPPRLGIRKAATLAAALLLGPALVRAQEHAPASKPTAPLPASVDLRPLFKDYGLPPRPQGARGTCSVFTAVGAIEFSLAKTSSFRGPLSVEFANWASNQAAGHRGDGSFFDDCLSGFRKHGICSEAAMPYQPVYDPETRPSARALKEAELIKSRASTEFEVHWILPPRNEDPGLTPRQLAEVKAALARGNPVAFGSGHSVLLVGYEDDAKKPGGGEFRTKDSAANAFRTYTYEFVRTKPYDVFWVEFFEKPRPQTARTHWEYSGGSFKKAGGAWNEIGKSGGRFTFEETARNEDWVEMRDASRDLTVRIIGIGYSRLFYKTPQMRRWELMYDGHWAE
jgi:hypothetical protein